jgi:tRNA threonylcarbamoyladenosine biosynthesis protein TsaB
LSSFIKILAIDTSTEACSVAVSLGEYTIDDYEVVSRAHTKILLPMINRLLKEAKIDVEDLDALAFGRGPGSFTGVRVACSVIQALSFGLHKPVVPVSTLQALAQGAYRELGVQQVFATLDARLQEVYWGLFLNDGRGIMQPVTDEKVQLRSQIQLPPGSWDPVSGFPKALDIVEIAQLKYQLNQTVLAEHALPVYLRDEVINRCSKTRS